jgi:hypothetical protein
MHHYAPLNTALNPAPPADWSPQSITTLVIGVLLTAALWVLYVHITAKGDNQ